MVRSRSIPIDQLRHRPSVLPNIRFMFQWAFLWRSESWTNLDILKLSVEDDGLLSIFSIEVVVLGFGIEVGWVYGKSDFIEEISKLAENFDQMVEEKKQVDKGE